MRYSKTDLKIIPDSIQLLFNLIYNLRRGSQLLNTDVEKNIFLEIESLFKSTFTSRRESCLKYIDLKHSGWFKVNGVLTLSLPCVCLYDGDFLFRWCSMFVVSSKKKISSCCRVVLDHSAGIVVLVKISILLIYFQLV